MSVSLTGCAAYEAGVETIMGDAEEWNEMLEKFEKYKVENEGKKGAPASWSGTPCLQEASSKNINRNKNFRLVKGFLFFLGQ